MAEPSDHRSRGSSVHARRSRRSAASWTLMAADCPLDLGVLHDKASGRDRAGRLRARGLSRAARRLRQALRDIDGLHGPGILNFHMQILQALKNRLLLTDLLTRHPEIRDIELAPPVVIAGLPRTGTTHLHNLLAAGRRSGCCATGRARAVPDARRGRCRARPEAGAHRHGRRLHEPGDAAFHADARDDHPACARGDPAPRSTTSPRC